MKEPSCVLHFPTAEVYAKTLMGGAWPSPGIAAVHSGFRHSSFGRIKDAKTSVCDKELGAHRGSKNPGPVVVRYAVHFCPADQARILFLSVALKSKVPELFLQTPFLVTVILWQLRVQAWDLPLNLCPQCTASEGRLFVV